MADINAEVGHARREHRQIQKSKKDIRAGRTRPADELLRELQEKTIVKNLNQTCFATPSQWEGSVGTRGSIFIRYRHGVLRVDLSKTNRKAWENGVTILKKEIGDRFNGYMETSDMKRELSAICRFQGRTKMHEDWYSLKRIGKTARRKRQTKLMAAYERVVKRHGKTFEKLARVK